MSNDNDAARPKTINVPKGGSVTAHFELTPYTKDGKDWKLKCTDQGAAHPNVSSLNVSFDPTSSPEQAAAESAICIISMSPQADGWTFENTIHIYDSTIDPNDRISYSLVNNVMTVTFKALIEDSQQDLSDVDYGFVASFGGQTYIQPDPTVRVGRP